MLHLISIDDSAEGLENSAAFLYTDDNKLFQDILRSTDTAMSQHNLDQLKKAY
jgi:hypothetical protein